MRVYSTRQEGAAPLLVIRCLAQWILYARGCSGPTQGKMPCNSIINMLGGAVALVSEVCQGRMIARIPQSKRVQWPYAAGETSIMHKVPECTSGAQVIH